MNPANTIKICRRAPLKKARHFAQALEHADLGARKSRPLDHKVIQQRLPHRKCQRHDERRGQQKVLRGQR